MFGSQDRSFVLLMRTKIMQNRIWILLSVDCRANSCAMVTN